VRSGRHAVPVWARSSALLSFFVSLLRPSRQMSRQHLRQQALLSNPFPIHQSSHHHRQCCHNKPLAAIASRCPIISLRHRIQQMVNAKFLFLRKCCRLNRLAIHIHSHLSFPGYATSMSLNNKSVINNIVISPSDSRHSLGAGRPTTHSIPDKGKVFSLLQSVRTTSGANPTSYSMSAGAVKLLGA
jgi:hypothetical protein